MNKFSRFKSLLEKLNRIDGLQTDVNSLKRELEIHRLLTGKLLSRRILDSPPVKYLHEAEFKVFSQWGDDGIIQYLVNHLDLPVRKFVEFGVENYTEANTRFLLLNDNWTGLVMDGSEKNVSFIKSDAIYWKYDLTAKAVFITTENINATLSEAGFCGEIGLLHIDVDGNDYWIWKAIEVASPVIAIIEYNSLFGNERTITIPYDPSFYRFDAHHSGIYAGASLAALCDLAEEKDYAFVGSNSAGNNAYFVRKDRLGDLKALSAEQGYIASKFREHRDEQGQLTFLPGHEAIERIRGMKVFNTRTQKIEEL